MFRWEDVEPTTLFGMTVRMYREPFYALNTVTSPLKGWELDHYAYKYFNSEIFMYRVLDVNFERFIEERGDVPRMEGVEIPTAQDTVSGEY